MLEQVEIPGTKEKARETVEIVKISALKKGMPELERLYMEQKREVAPPFKTEIAARISGSLHGLSRRRERQ
jgi:hypothetical protein